MSIYNFRVHSTLEINHVSQTKTSNYIPKDPMESANLDISVNANVRVHDTKSYKNDKQ